MALKKSKSNAREQWLKQEAEALRVSDEAQNRLAEILADQPTIIKFAGTEWEIFALRMGTQYLMAHEICELSRKEHATYEDALRGVEDAIPTIIRVIALILLNDKNKIFQNGDQKQGYSKLFKRTCDTIEWNTSRDDMMNLFGECLSLIDVSFFMEALGMLQIFRASVTEKKRTRTKTQGRR